MGIGKRKSDVIMGISEEAVLQELETLAERLGIEVQYEHLEGSGGLCRYGGQFHLILNRTLSPRERVEAFVQALAIFPLDDVFVLPRLRAMIEAQRALRT